jgi:hypothetical protein
MLAQISASVRENLANILARDSESLARLKGCTAKSLQTRVDIAEPMSRTARTVFGWGDDSSSGLVSNGEDEIVEIECTSEPVAQPTPLVVPCGVPTPDDVDITPNVEQ